MDSRQLVLVRSHKYGKLLIIIFFLILCGCNKREDSTSNSTKKEIPVTLHIVNLKGEPKKGVTVTIVEFPKSDKQPSIERGQILGKTDKKGNIYWQDGIKGNYFVVLNKNKTPVSIKVSLTEEKKNSSITLIIED
ncbi:DUF2606 family protein [Heyndrickxia sp. NPDC080065]|uniref:DUF2606 family protein n=1 Tax=Heyndrickxia sp. NPDC080065 TaxID=3390568 RepID=UPI003D08CE0A